MHIGLIGPLPPPFGGMANQTKQLNELLTSEGLKVTLVRTNADYKWHWVTDLKGIRALARLLPYLLELWRVAGNVECMHVMANSGWSWQLYAAPAIWIGWIRKVPVVVNYRGGDAERYFKSSIRWVAPSLNKATVLVVPSMFLFQVFELFGYKAKVIPNIINLERFKFKPHLISNNRSLRLVITRNLEKIYGIDAAIHAVAILKSILIDVKLVIAGSGPLQDELKGLAETLELSHSVEFVGKLEPEQIAKLYYDADIMLNPATVDNMPNSVLEALACGLPVITTNVGGIPFIVKDNESALMVESNNAQMLADAILKLVNDSDLYNKLAVNGFAVANQYGWCVVKEQWLGLYKELVDAS
ncbi:glycosyltransferase family 4 protein [Methylomonas sp. DH-1]|uniref:glycosyltransferase family 4 protein n=1 Tax=Methylomonas sp. (strain DH-1) TaxID=1727196 RepID=UPI0007C8FE82|nr:glycosyltransferase family 4 protein [Methylomonas sp. DH-1]ANE56310.1 glycosyl transferase family 1 [Methylomonas sp. DH-1]